MFGPESTATGRPRTSVESRSPVAGSSPFVEAEHRRVAGSARRRPEARLGRQRRRARRRRPEPRRASARPRTGRRRRSAGCARVAIARTSWRRERDVSRSASSARTRPPRAAADDDDLSRACAEVDRHRHALELEPLAQLVLDPVGVVARDEARVVDGEAEARRARRRPARRRAGSGAVALGRRLARLPQLAEEAVQLRRRDAVACLSKIGCSPRNRGRRCSAGGAGSPIAAARSGCPARTGIRRSRPTPRVRPGNCRRPRTPALARCRHSETSTRHRSHGGCPARGRSTRPPSRCGRRPR